MNRRLLVSRMASGFGDWIMLTAVMKMFNNSEPDIDIDLMIRSGIHTDLWYLPTMCGVRCRLVTEQEASTIKYDHKCLHAVYKNPRPETDEHLAQGMLYAVRAPWAVQVPYDPNVRVRPLILRSIELPDFGKPYVVMASVGRGAQIEKIAPAYAHSLPKEWSGMDELSKLLSRHYTIIQIGLSGDPVLTGAVRKYDNLPLEALSYLYTRVEFGVSIENGLSHWAGHHDVRNYTIFTSHLHARPPHVAYPSVIPLTEPIGWQSVYERIMHEEAQRHAHRVKVL